MRNLNETLDVNKFLNDPQYKIINVWNLKYISTSDEEDNDTESDKDSEGSEKSEDESESEKKKGLSDDDATE